MATLHIIDPTLRYQGGHFLGQHVALANLFGPAGFQIVSYTDIDFDEQLLPEAMSARKVFSQADTQALAPHYSVTLGAMNQACLEQLRTIDSSTFADDDILFLTSATAERVVAYGQWLKEIMPGFHGKVAIYNTVTAELDDSIGRDLRRNGLTLSDESFESLDAVVVPNQTKRSMYRYLFDSIPAERVGDVKVFYEEPFPGRGYFDLCAHPEIDFVYLHSMYPGQPGGRAPSNTGERVVAYMGSGGVSFRDKGRHLLPDVVSNVSKGHSDTRFVLHLGSASVSDAAGELPAIEAALRVRDNVSIESGGLDCDDYCRLIEGADVVVMPYGPRYRHIMSGIFDDCLFLGIPCVIPARSKMGLWLERHNIDYPAFKAWDEVGVTAALNDALDNFEHYSEQFSKAQAICRQRWQKLNPLAVLCDV